MTRREALKQTGLIAGYALAMPSLATVLQACESQKRPEWQAVFFNKEQADLVTELVEMILPHTRDLPGAWDLGVHSFIDTFVGQVWLKEDQDKLLAGLTEIAQQFPATYNKPFMECSKKEHYELIDKINKEQMDKANEQPDDHVYWPPFLKFKELTFLAYFTSEKVGTEILHYDPIPGAYQGCVPISEVGKVNWSY